MRFEQSRPTSFERLRSEIEDLAGVPIRYDVSLGSDPPERSVAVTVALSNGADAFGAPFPVAGLGYQHKPDGPWMIGVGNAL